ncbi:methyltransferase 10 domain-containing protein [Capsaspora owczarzaki ATCC 30864]|uniref:Methyltransferase 10 domain-containing protein n=1 Tax=Capsaspora owczarzaki (strain ATCC 30864) TaxID=595528 RepID=A0A0D2WNC2_CAPO3|nr:methyltransferase 10 domain-containing protein [Capsaspora owczarzaki ATCC 30864]KJE91873.1 methyltransferase 10 domain-containing protein [Capsaspora owczarzaki ATCC 30864]|eukprot:XP_004363779.1 methyltransferase 10 domain-containing protein [Capsaspora owczarzaki ATCC 30864]
MKRSAQTSFFSADARKKPRQDDKDDDPLSLSAWNVDRSADDYLVPSDEDEDEDEEDEDEDHDHDDGEDQDQDHRDHELHPDATAKATSKSDQTVVGGSASSKQKGLPKASVTASEMTRAVNKYLRDQRSRALQPASQHAAEGASKSNPHQPATDILGMPFAPPHRRNVYIASPPNFSQLAEAYAPLRAFLRANNAPAPKQPADNEPPSDQQAEAPGLDTHSPVDNKSPEMTLDFSQPRAVAALSQAILHADFKLTVQIPDGTLVPTVPSRLNYILWIESLVTLHRRATTKRQKDSHGEATKQPVSGIDIGTGATCIYPLMATSLFPDWSFVATDINPDSLQHAKQNVAANEAVAARIRLLQQQPEDELLHGALGEAGTCDFVMCNPPFYETLDHVPFANSESTTAPASRNNDEPGPPRRRVRPQTKLAAAALITETVTSGGEVEFVRQLIKESEALQTRITWYTSLLGHKSSLVTLFKELHGRTDIAVTWTELRQGRTIRWVIAWTYLLHPRILLQIGDPRVMVHHEYTVPAESLDTVATSLVGALREVNLEAEVYPPLGIALHDFARRLETPSPAHQFRTVFVRPCVEGWTHDRQRRRAMQRLAREQGEAGASSVVSQPPTETHPSRLDDFSCLPASPLLTAAWRIGTSFAGTGGVQVHYFVRQVRNRASANTLHLFAQTRLQRAFPVAQPAPTSEQRTSKTSD